MAGVFYMRPLHWPAFWRCLLPVLESPRFVFAHQSARSPQICRLPEGSRRLLGCFGGGHNASHFDLHAVLHCCDEGALVCYFNLEQAFSDVAQCRVLGACFDEVKAIANG